MIHFYEQGVGTPLIFLHGMGATAKTWQFQLAHFGQSYHAIALDLPGYGGSAPLPENSFDALAAWLHEAIAANGWTRPHLVGNSYGGMIVQQFLYRYPGVAETAVFCGTSPAFGRRDGDWQQNFVRARLEPLDNGLHMADIAPKVVAGLVGSAAQAEGIRLAIADMATVSDHTFRTVVHTLVTFDRRDNLGNIDIPCLLIVGDEDRNAPPPMMEKMSSYISNAQFVQLPKLGHIAHIENPAQFNAPLAKFLARFC